MATEADKSVPTIESRLFDAARAGDVATLTALLDEHPDKLHARDEPYAMTLLHVAAQHLPAVDLLLRRGLDPNVRDRGDNSYAMHWAAAAGKLDVVQRLAEAGGDVIGQGDDHALEVIGWATSWGGCDDPAHRAVADFLVSRGAAHHIYSAIALDLANEVRRIVRDDPPSLSRRMSRNEDNQLPLHFAARMNRPDMVALLIELGADPLGVDAWGNTVALYAITPDVDRAAMGRILELASRELESANRGGRKARVTMTDLVAALALADWGVAERVVRDEPTLVSGGILHIMAKRGDLPAVEWLLSRGADPSATWLHWDAAVTPLHLAILGDHTAVARALLDAGADATVRDSKHDADALGWAEFFRREPIVRLLRRRAT